MSLAQVWGQVKDLIADGISIIPVRDKEEVTKLGDTYGAKTPYAKWKEFQNRQITEHELWTLMEEKGTEAIAIICGKISGNMEVIDIDVKYRPGIDAIIMNDIRTFYPDLFSRLRIHKTPSSGFHIIYRVSSGDIPGNLKLAGRMASEAEIELQITKGVKRPNKEVNFLETRGTGGYFLCPPSMGYTVHVDNPIPVITWEERCALITLCQSYNEIIKEAPAIKANKTQDSIYDENPFEHFNRECDPKELLESFGWKYSHHNNHFIWFTRPDKSRGVSASWNIDKRIFYVFTSSTELQSDRGYNAATVLAELMFEGDKSKTYYHLISQGFGRVKKKVEQARVKAAAISNKDVPANFSAEAKQQLQQLKVSLQEDHPYGLFIKYDSETEKLAVSYEMLIHVSEKLGIYNLNNEVVYVNGHVVQRIDSRKFQDILKDYIKEEDPEDYEKLCNVFEKFMKENTKFITTRLTFLNQNRFIKDSRDTCYKFYKNGYLTINKEEFTFSNYDTIGDGLIWESQIQQRFYKESAEGGRFVEFLNLALVNPKLAMPVLGYLAHDYKDETTGYIIVLTEACQDPKQGGGSGKNVFCNLLKLTTTYVSRAGSQSKFDDKFFQIWNGQRVFGVSDLPKNFDFADFKEPATGEFAQKKLYKDETVVSVEEGPKFVMQTNFSYTDSDGGLLRRIIPLEFTDFFTRCGGIDIHFGCHFPKGWTDEDFAGYDNFIAHCIQQWMMDGLKLTPGVLTEDGWIKKFELNYGKTAATFIIERFNAIIKDGKIANKSLRDMLHAYHVENRINQRYEAAYETIGKALKAYCDRKGIDIITGYRVRVDALQVGDGRKFEALTEEGREILDAAANLNNNIDPF